MPDARIKRKRFRMPFRIVSKRRFVAFILGSVLIASLISQNIYHIINKEGLSPGTKNVLEEISHPIKKAAAAAQFVPTAGTLRNGSEIAITSAAIAATNGTNVGSWKGTLADDNFHWMVNSTSTGYDLNLTLGGVELNGANMMMIETEIDLDATTPQTYFQICDWEGVLGSGDGDADSDCGTEDEKGVWRTLNLRKTVFNSNTATAFHFQIYDGYWSNGSNTPISTPLANFVNGSSQVKIRYYSTINSTASPVAIDYLRIYSVINPVYSPADFTDNIGIGTTVGDYTDTVLGFYSAATYSDNNRNGASGTVGSAADFYWSFKNAKTYTGMNTIVVRAETSCDATGINYRPQIKNDTTGLFEEISSNDIACATSDQATPNVWSFTPSGSYAIDDYISASGEIKVGFKGQADSATLIQADFIYIILGTTNTDENNDCEISFGSGTATNCTNTRTIDTIGADSAWDNPAEDESTNQGHEFYPADTDADANAEEAGAAHVKFAVTQPSNTAVTGLFFASRHKSGTAGTVIASLRDYSGSYAATGGFTDVGSSATTSMVYTDNVAYGTTAATIVASGGPSGLINNPEDYLDSVGNEMWMRLRTSTDPSAASNVTNQWDFSFVSMQWIEDADHPSKSYQFTPTSGSLTNGTAQNVAGVGAAAVQGINTGWKGALADDNYHWAAAADSDGIDMNFTFDNAQLNGANAFLIETELDLDATVPSIYFQICDWVEQDGRDDTTDAVCNPASEGGWRTINLRDAAFTYESTSTSTGSVNHYQIYNGYWSNGTNTPYDTPLSNFISPDGEIKIRVHSTTNTTSVVAVDYLRIFSVINPVYPPADLEYIGVGATYGDYTNAIIGHFASSMPSGSDNVYSGSVSAGGAETAPNSYWSFKNIKTYDQMNTVVVRTEHSCAAAAGLAYRPVIYKFTDGGSWTDISTGSIACATGDNTSAWAFTPTGGDTLIDDYISSGEMRVGFRSLSGTGTTIRADWIYIMLGTTNTDSSDCEISFGTGIATDCTKTRDMDFTGPLNTWDIAKEDEATTRTDPFYALDNDGDVDLEEAAAGHVKMEMASPKGTGVAGIFYSTGLLGGLGYNELASGRTYGTVRDTSGFTGIVGGFSALASYHNTSMSYLDNVNSAVVTSGGISGITLNPEDYVDSVDNEIWYRFRNSISGSLGNNLASRLDFIMMSLQWIESATNADPTAPTGLGPAGYIDAASWMNDNTPTFDFTLADPDTGQHVKYQIQISNTSNFSNIIVDYTSALADQGAASFTVGQAAGSGTYNNGHGNPGQTLSDSVIGGGYYWRVKTIDYYDKESAYEEAGTDAQIDFRVDATAPTGGTVNDGLVGDQDWNDGSLTGLSANWTGFNGDTSGIQYYEYALKRQSDERYWDGDSWEVAETWTNVGVGTSVNPASPTLQTSEIYYASVKATDNAGNIESAVNSNGQQVLPTLSFSISSNAVNFANLNSTNNWTDDAQTITTTTSTNASQGYTAKVYNTQDLTSTNLGIGATVANFSGTWDAPLVWNAGTYGFGYSSSDTSVQGENRFDSHNKFAAFSQTAPGDICADHTDAINGTTGAVFDEDFIIYYKVAVPEDQPASNYKTYSIFTVTANY